jgi:hypothetical protein
MMNDDNSLQEKIEAGQIPDTLDAKSYASVFHALAKEPDISLPVSFADRIIQRTLALQQSKESKRDIWWLGIGIFLLTVAFIVAFAFVGFRMNPGFLRAASDYKWMFLMGVILVWIFNVVDKKFVKPANLPA